MAVAEKEKEQVPATPGNGDAAKVPATAEPSMSARFTAAVVREFSGTIGQPIQLDPYKKRLAQHLFLRIDAALQEAESKRQDRNKPSITWNNVNMTKLATDAMHRIDLGLDAAIEATIYPIAYLNGRTQKYDLDLRVGYKGELYYRTRMALSPLSDMPRIELVHEKDHFRALKKNPMRQVESYEFEIAENAFDRGKVVGGFGYIEYEDEKKNVLVLVTAEDLKKSEAKAGNDKFWGPYPDEMKYKTIVHRTTAKIPVDPEKVNAAYLAIQRDADVIDAEVVSSGIKELANRGPVLGLEHEAGETEVLPPAEGTPEPQPEPAAEQPEEKTISGTIKCADTGAMVARGACEKCQKRKGCPSHDAAPSLPLGEEKKTDTAKKRRPGY